MKQTNPIWAQRIKVLLKEKGMKQKDLAAIGGLTTTTVCDTVNGKREPGVLTLVSIANALGVSMDYLMGTEPTISEIEEVSGYSLRELKTLFLVGYTLHPPEQLTIESFPFQ